MTHAWDPVTYLERAKVWREKAVTLPETDPNRALHRDCGRIREAGSPDIEAPPGGKSVGVGASLVCLEEEGSRGCAPPAEEIGRFGQIIRRRLAEP